MSYRTMARRLEELEAKREQQERAEYQAWAESLSDAELEALLEERVPGFVVAYEALSDADRERLVEGTMTEAEWQQHLQQARLRQAAAQEQPMT